MFEHGQTVLGFAVRSEAKTGSATLYILSIVVCQVKITTNFSSNAETLFMANFCCMSYGLTKKHPRLHVFFKITSLGNDFTIL